VSETLLELRRLRKEFGGLMAVFDISLSVQAGEIVAIIGPNGAGKTTVFNLISGVLRPTAGDIYLRGREITDLRPHAITRLGLARTFQNVQLFSKMTVLENVMVGCHSISSYGLLAAALRLPHAREREKQTREQAEQRLARVGLKEKSSADAMSLPFGQQRLLEIARALAANPTLLLLDEPGSGLNRPEKAELERLIRAIREDGITVLLVEHDMQFVMSIADRIVVLEYGQKIAEGTPVEVQSDVRVVSAYLGDRKFV
jgi:ABC-type branched-subunit amino acid transport system ATPase component